MKRVKKKWIILMVVLITNIFYLGIIYKQNIDNNNLKEKLNDSIRVDHNSIFLEEEKNCLEFVQKNLSSSSGGIYTNYLDENKTYEYSTGHEILSESVGLFMIYCVENNLEDQFVKQYKLLRDKMINKDGLVKWRIKEEDINMSNTSASIDDLRIIRGLLMAYECWNQKEYLNTALKIGDNLLKYNITNGILNNYKNPDDINKAKDIDLSYIDLYTMKLLSKYNESWKNIYSNGLKVIKKGYVSDEMPLYKKSYNIEKEIFADNKEINMINTTLVLLHLSEVGEIKDESIDWLKEQLRENEKVFNQYNKNNKLATTVEESTAVYAIIAAMAKSIKDDELYNLVMEKMLKLQVLEVGSPINGGFGNPNDLQVYSFDNLLALLAF